jgi:hypothetical protein
MKQIIGSSVNSNVIVLRLGCEKVLKFKYEKTNKRTNNERVNRMAHGRFLMHFPPMR